MTDRPIPFSARMVRALLNGSKTQTRRVIKDATKAPRFAVGDRLWVRETFNWAAHDDLLPGENHSYCHQRAAYSASNVVWRADGERAHPIHGPAVWRPSIHMPRYASRLTLIVTEVRVERLQDCSEADAVAEGIERMKSGRGFYDVTAGKGAVHAGLWHTKATEAFQSLWNSINGHGAWEANPWVCALSFTVHQKNIDRIEAEQ